MKKAFLISAFFLPVAFATESEFVKQNEDINAALAGAYEPNWFSMLFGLCVVVGLIYLTGFIYQKMVKVNINNETADNEIKIVTSKSLGQNKTLHIIKTNGEYSLIGATPSNITFIKDIKYKNAAENITEDKFDDTTGENRK